MNRYAVLIYDNQENKTICNDEVDALVFSGMQNTDTQKQNSLIVVGKSSTDMHARDNLIKAFKSLHRNDETFSYMLEAILEDTMTREESKSCPMSIDEVSKTIDRKLEPEHKTRGFGFMGRWL